MGGGDFGVALVAGQEMGDGVIAPLECVVKRQAGIAAQVEYVAHPVAVVPHVPHGIGSGLRIPRHIRSLAFFAGSTQTSGAVNERMRMMIAKGGKSVYGAPLGILMLDTTFPRILGDMGNAQTFDFPVLYKVVRGAYPDLVVRRGAEGMLDRFIAAGRALVADGCAGITTTCGFLALFQEELADALGVPVMTSALMQAGVVQGLLPPARKVGILTISPDDLTQEHLEKAHVPRGLPVWGVEVGCHFQTVILDGELELDVARAEADMVAAASAFVAAHPELGALLFECTNMPPYAEAVKAATGLPVFSSVSMAEWLYGSLKGL